MSAILKYVDSRTKPKRSTSAPTRIRITQVPEVLNHEEQNPDPDADPTQQNSPSATPQQSSSGGAPNPRQDATKED